MDNIWFYTLSTSAQVLAALAGIFAVFVVWKIQDFEKILSETRLAVIKLFSYASANTKDYETIKLETLYSMTDSELLDKFSELLSIKINEPSRISVSETIRSENLIHYSLDEFTKNLYHTHINKKLNILKDLKNILVVNFLVISICIITLTFSNIIYYKFLILIIISLAVLLCLYLISSGIYRITVR